MLDKREVMDRLEGVIIDLESIRDAEIIENTCRIVKSFKILNYELDLLEKGENLRGGKGEWRLKKSQ